MKTSKPMPTRNRLCRCDPQWFGLFALLAWLGGGTGSGTAASLVSNGSMSEGGAGPAGWSNVWTASNGGQLRVLRDVNEYRRAPASLWLDDVAAQHGRLDHAVKFQTCPRGRDEWIVLLIVAENEFVMRNQETL